MSRYLWILDNGHGEDTPGKRSPLFEDGSQLFEYEFNRSIVQNIVIRLVDNGIYHHVLVPEMNDVPLEFRVQRANELYSDLPKLFVSVHGNACGSGQYFKNPSGIETYHYPSSIEGRRIASVFQEKLIEEVGWKDRGIKTANFRVLKHTRMPSILTENGFFTNQDECLKMLSIRWRERIAEAHFQAIQFVEDNNIL